MRPKSTPEQGFHFSIPIPEELRGPRDLERALIEGTGDPTLAREFASFVYSLVEAIEDVREIAIHEGEELRRPGEIGEAIQAHLPYEGRDY